MNINKIYEDKPYSESFRETEIKSITEYKSPLDENIKKNAHIIFAAAKGHHSLTNLTLGADGCLKRVTWFGKFLISVKNLFTGGKASTDEAECVAAVIKETLTKIKTHLTDFKTANLNKGYKFSEIDDINKKSINLDQNKQKLERIMMNTKYYVLQKI